MNNSYRWPDSGSPAPERSEWGSIRLLIANDILPGSNAEPGLQIDAERVQTHVRR